MRLYLNRWVSLAVTSVRHNVFAAIFAFTLSLSFREEKDPPISGSNLDSGFLPLGQERSTKSHEIAQTKRVLIRVIPGIAFLLGNHNLTVVAIK